MFFYDLTIFLLAHSLRAPSEEFPKILKELQDHFQGIEFNHPQAPNSQAIAAREASGAYISFIRWITSLQEAGALVFPALPSPWPDGEYFPPESAINQGTNLLWLSSQGSLTLLALSSEYSPELWITGTELEGLIDAQARPGIEGVKLWQEITQGVLRNEAKFQGRSEVSQEDAKHHLRHERLQFLHGQQRIVEILEDYLWEQGQELVIPLALRNKLASKKTPPRRFNKIQSPKLVGSLTGSEMLALIDEQKNSRTMETFITILKQLSKLKPSLSKTLSTAIENSADLRELLPTLSQSQADQIPSDIFIDLLGEGFKVPPFLEEKFKPPYPPDTRLQQRWVLETYPDPWQVYYFKQITPDGSVLPMEKASALFTTAKKNFQNTLERIVSEAPEVEKKFGTFSSALKVITDPALELSSAADFKRTAQLADLSETALDRLDGSLVFLLQKIFKLSDEKVRLLLATEVCNIFQGGMGSWNDGPSSSETSSISDLPQDLAELKTVLYYALE